MSKSILKGLSGFLITLLILIYAFDLNYLVKAVRTIYLKGHTTAFIDDYSEFDNRIIKNDTPEAWPKHNNYNKSSEPKLLKDTNDKYGTAAYLVIKNDSILFENYYQNYNANSKTNSFSMAKSMVSAMLGKAIQEGYIKSLDTKVGDYINTFRTGNAENLTVGDLSSMASGSNWDESYKSPFSVTTKAYFYDDLATVVKDIKIKSTPGEKYKYLSGDTQILAMVLQKATGQNLSDYLSNSFWKPMGANHEALWQIDSEDFGLEKAYCCVASNAKDFARFGKLYKNHGYWNGKKILDSSFVATSTKGRFKESPHYGFGWWIIPNYNGKRFFMMRGHLGQYVIVQPDDDLIIVRLGQKAAKKSKNDVFSADIYKYIDSAYSILSND